jgi:5-methylcytosine-specific restriction protein A
MRSCLDCYVGVNMPNKPMKICNYPGCSQLVQSGYCEKHTKPKDNKVYNRQRGSSSSRGYDSRWQRFREIYMRSHPLCVICEEKGYIIKADLIHHKTPLDKGGEKYADDNLISVCNACHESIHCKDRWRKKDG